MKLIVDRIEGDFAVCEKDDLKTVHIPLVDLPDGVHEGSVLDYNNGTYAIDIVTEAERRAKLKALKNSIFNE